MPHIAPLHLSAEPSLVTDRETPSYDVGVTEFNPWNLPLDSLVNHNGLTVEPTDSHRPVSIATQSHDFAALNAPSSTRTSLFRSEADQSRIERFEPNRFIGQLAPNVVQGDKGTSMQGQTMSFGSLPTSEHDVHAELALLRAQVERLHSVVLPTGVPLASPSDQTTEGTSSPPPYPQSPF